MDFRLSDEQVTMVETIREILSNEFGSHYFRKLEDDGVWPFEVMKRLGEAGFIGIVVPEAYGGGGGTTLDSTVCLEEASRQMAGSAMAYFTTMCFGARAFSELGTEAQRERILPKLLSGETFVGLSLTEPDGGTDILGAMRSHAKPDGHGNYVINGAKMFTTGAHIADWIITVVRTDGFEERRSYGVTMFLVPADSPGLTIEPIPLVTQRSTGANLVTFQDVVVPEENIFGELNRGLNGLFNVLNDERIGAAAMCLGIAQGAFDEALEYSKHREAFGRPIGQFQAVQHALADSWVKLQAMRNIVYEAAWRQSNGLSAELESSAAKLYASETAVDIVTSCMDVLGGYQMTLEYNMSYFWSSVQAFTFAPITNNAVRNFIGEKLGLPKSY